MGWLKSIFSLGGESAAKPIEAIGRVIDSVSTSDEERLQAQAVLERLRQRPDELQAAINQIEASHRSLFVAGGRPAVLWICALALFNIYLLNPWLQWITGDPGPQLPLDVVEELVYAILGLGGYRMMEKMNGRAK